ncbi:MAG: hypothetical protein E7330_07500 [Clostridiales bacterium]|nr:hypothetical protein [Clostridiales bacterium]
MIGEKRRLIFHAAAHFTVDLSCFFALWSAALRSQDAPLLILLYNFLAFALQAPIGALLDRCDDARPYTILGCGLVAWGVLSLAYPVLSVLLLGLGNALFHVGGAVTSLRHRPGDALFAGVFVSPGALGVALGTLAGKDSLLSPLFFVLLLLVSIGCIWLGGTGAKRQCEAFLCPSPLDHIGAGAIMCCLVSIGIRSFAGFTVKTLGSTALFVLLGAAASCLGKFFGGILAKGLPHRIVGLLGVGIGGLMMAFFPESYTSYGGIFLFNLAMPLTLSAVMAALPGHAGFGFGLTTLALFLGSAPLYALPDGYTASLPLMAVLTLFAAFLLFFSLKEKVPAAKAAEALSEYIPTYEEEIT